MEQENKNIGRLVKVDIESEIKKSYLDYAMSVIVDRALPDVRDGLKPVHRRILFAMNEMGNAHNKPYKKSARIVGDVIGKYHPHGDMAVYDAIVRMVQDFSLRHPLVDGQGNFGSVDGDAAAAMRYTEIRMARIAEEMLADIDKETVDFVPNYDESLVEPSVLPTRVPCLLVNGSAGIAVGMATNIPPHNLGEVVDALVHLIDHPDATVEALMGIVPGPDFPTYGFIYGRQGIRDAYRTGRGIIRLRAKAEVEEMAGGRSAIVVTEIPYQVNKARLIEQIVRLVKEEKRIDGITEIRDESDRQGMRVVIELRRDVEPEIILNQLFKHTSMQTSFGINMVAIDRGQPTILNLRQALVLFLAHRREVVTRRTRYELRKARERAHILEGLKIALDHLDEVISLIRASKTPPEAKAALVARFGFSEVQAQAILEMRLQRLTNLEREKILEEYRQTLLLIAELEEILASEPRLMNVIRGELLAIRQTYANPRRTVIVDESADLQMEDLVADEDSIIAVSHAGYIKRTSADTYRVQRRGGKGRRGMSTGSEDFTRHAFTASNHSYLLIFTDRGKAYWLRVFDIPEVGSAGKGRPIVNLVKFDPEEKITDIIATKDFPENEYVVLATARGIVKKTPLSEYSRPKSIGIIAQSVPEGDRLIAVSKTAGSHEIFLATRQGQSIRFPENDVRAMGRTACGVIGIRLREGDEVVSMTVLDRQGDILTVTRKGFGKKTSTEEYRLQGRGGYGIINTNVTARTGEAVGVCFIECDCNLVLITAGGQIIRMNTAYIRSIGRGTQGVKLMDIDDDDELTSFTLLAAEDEESAENGDSEFPDEAPTAE
ncbi:MAG: DNA gyrase subunit A [Acidobacteria bacterium]|nr:DNA gyrase subunit A [Acidobacteriota bacterium]